MFSRHSVKPVYKAFQYTVVCIDTLNIVCNVILLDYALSESVCISLNYIRAFTIDTCITVIYPRLNKEILKIVLVDIHII